MDHRSAKDQTGLLDAGVRAEPGRRGLDRGVFANAGVAPMVVGEIESARPAWTERLHEWTTTVDHKKIGILYVLMSLFFLVIAGAEALLMRWQLFYPHSEKVGPEMFN